MAIPDVTIAGVPVAGNCCLTQIHKKAEGNRSAVFGPPYPCDTGQTTRGDTQFRLKLVTSGPPCDQNPPLIPDGSTLEVKGNTIRRADNFAHFFGTFVIRRPNNGPILFRGRMEALDRIGTHHPPFGTEACNEQGHLEGWLVGRGSTLLPNHTLRALITARASLPTGTAPATVSASLDGVLIKCP